MKLISAKTILGLSALLLTAACTDEQVENPADGARAISFTSATETRAAVEGNTLPGNFKVWGGYEGNAINVFNGETVQHPNWTYTGGTQYWIPGKTYNFYGVYPTSVNAFCDENGTLTVSGFNCYKTGNEAVDLMTASQTGISYAAGVEPQPVSMQFGHELARVNVVATVEGGDATVTNIVFAGMATSGNYSSTVGWSNTAKGSFANPTHQTLNTEGVDLLGDMLLIPQAVSGFTLTVDYTVGGVAQPQKVITLPTTISQWDKGKSYKYTLSFKRNRLTVTVKVVDWNEEDTSVSWG